MTFERRVRKIETALGPKQAVRRWLMEAQRFPRYEEYLREIAGEPMRGSSLEIIPAQVAKAMEDRVRFKFSWPAEARTKAVREAHEQTKFLMALVFVINNWSLKTMVRSGLVLWARQEQLCRMSQQLRTKLSDHEEWIPLREMLAAHLSILRALKAATAAVSADWFDGQSVLFSQQEVELDSQIEETRTMVNLYNTVNTVRRASPSWSPIELDGVPGAVETRRLVRQWEDSARARALIGWVEAHYPLASK